MTEESSFSLRHGDTAGRVLAVIAIGAIARFLLASTVGLGVDESYAVAVARQFSLSYFDHPPLHFWIAGAMAKLARSEAPEVVRLPFVLCFAGTTWFIWRITQRLFGDRAGLTATILLSVSAVFSLSTGGWVLPDGPLMLLMSAAVDRISWILFSPPQSSPQSSPQLVSWLAAGVLTGLAMLSKYHGVFVLAGTAAFLVTSPRHRWWLTTPGPYLGTALALAMFAPVIVWNSQHEWVSFAFQGARAARASGIHFDTFLANIGGQMAWVLPWIFVPLAAAAWRALRSGPRDENRWFLLSIAAGPIVVFTLVSLLGSVGLPHWQAPGWLFVFPMLAAAVVERIARGEAASPDAPDAPDATRAMRSRHWLRWSVGSYIALIVVLTSHASTGWLARLSPAAFAKGDPTGDMVTWRQLRPSLEGLGYFPSNAFVATASWIQAGKAAVAMGPDIPVLCLCADPHHFFYLQSDSTLLGRDAVFVKKRREDDDVLTRFAPYFERIDIVNVVPVYRGSQQVMLLDIYRGKNFRAVYPTEQPR